MSGRLRMDTAGGRWVLTAAVGGSGLAMLDATVVNVALERIGRDLGAGFGSLQWIVNGYALSLAALILLGGALGDRFGRRRVFLIGVVWFALASALCGLAPNAPTLITARVLQGAGGALLTPGSLALIAASFDPADRSRAVGAWSGLGGVAGAIGPFLGGALVDWTWRAVFLVNLPVALVVLVITLRHVPESADPDAVPGLDLPGTLLAVTGLGALSWTLTAAGEGGGRTHLVAGGAAALAALAGFVLVERRSAHPLVPLSLFGDRVFAAANLVTGALYAGLGVFFVLFVLHLQTVAGFSPTAAGSALLPLTAMMLLLSARAGALADRVGARALLTVGPLLAAAGLLLTLRIGPGADYLTGVLPATVTLGLGLSATVAPLTATVLAAADEHQAGAASGVNNAVARTAGLLAVAVIPGLAGLAGGDYTDPGAFADGFRRAMLISAGLAAGAALLAALLIRATPAPHRAARRTGPGLRLQHCPHCGVQSPQLHPGPARAHPH